MRTTKPEQAAAYMNRKGYDARTLFVGASHDLAHFSLPIDITYSQAKELAKRVCAGKLSVDVESRTSQVTGQKYLCIHITDLHDVQDTLR